MKTFNMFVHLTAAFVCIWFGTLELFKLFTPSQSLAIWFLVGGFYFLGRALND